ncbi:MAG: phenylacetate-CoA oxygenase/reductase subunit PaaK [Flavobacteriales bacterium]|nr:phenylacetate-CoA oxygenase/reductase subunit PaaK [Flavobacteriales bacterium]
MSIEFYPLKVKEVRRETPECVSVSFEIPEELKETFKFTQGQYITIRKDFNGEEVRRSYSLCTSPYENDFRVAVKQMYDGVFSSFANKELKAGEILEVMPPLGKFFTHLHSDQKKNYIGFAAGSGITPIMSLIKTVMVEEPNSNFTLFYGNKNTESIIFREQLEALKNQYMGRLSLFFIMSREGKSIPLLSGHIDGEKCNEFAKSVFEPKDVDEAFICGPESMLISVKEALMGLGLDEKNIHFELFLSSGIAKKKHDEQPLEADVLSEVKVIIDGDEYDFALQTTDINILDAALKTGANLPFACKGGVCCTCRAKLLEGKVDMEVNYSLEPEELEEGYILTCQSHPLTKKVVVSYDEP